MNKTALVTGGNSGIGYETAKLLKKKGYVVFISGKNSAKIKQAADKLGVIPIVADMSILKDIKVLASHFLKDGLDVLVNNAAIAKFMPIKELTKEDFSTFFNTNVRGPLMLIQELLSALEKRQGCVTTVSSVIVNSAVPNTSLYAATKGAIDAFTRSLALELAPKKIRVNAIAPGAIDTPLFSKAGLNKSEVAELRRQQEATIPLRRYGKPEEVAEIIVAQAESSYTTGAIWTVDGGVDAY